MNCTVSKCMIIIIVIIIIIILSLIGVNWYNCRKKNIISYFTQDSSISYADSTDLYNKPFILNDFIDSDLCKQIINQSTNKLIDSQVLGGKHKKIRNSKQHWIVKNDPLVKPLFEKVSSMFNIPLDNAEDLQVVRYLPNQFYNEHHDSCCDNNDKCQTFVNEGGQRMLTVLIYLNDNFEEGHTNFPNLGVKLKPKKGSAIVFYPLAQNSSKCHPNALHAGMPVKSGEKWVANLWFRERKFR